MKKILVIGAGRSATSLINYLLEHAGHDGFGVVVVDIDVNLAREKVGDRSGATVFPLNIDDASQRRKFISDSDIVISMLPPELHYPIALDCLDLGRHMLTASYLSQEIAHLDSEVQDKNLLFMTEMGLDPGIDHMSARRLIAEINDKSGMISAFSSYTGGLISKESDDNPWHYKITWNPRNVVLAGNKTARFRRDGQEKFVPYVQLFRNARVVELPGQGKFDMYPNRDSVSYAHIYGFPDIKNILRGTLRHPGFCQAWGALIALGLTDPDTRVNGDHFTTYRDLLLAFLPAGKEQVREKIMHYACLSDADIVEQILWLFDDTPIPKRKMTVADLLENLILQKWGLKENDKDLVVMQHEIDYELGEVKMRSQSSMSMMGENKNNTAMANLVGLPLGICARYLLQEKIRLTGVRRPVDSEVYVPVLQELENYGVLFTEKAISLA